MTAPLPANERERLEALRAFEVLDSDPEADFDDLVKVASLVCGTPIALISLIDERRQWFKARVGLEITETPRDRAFCAHTILDNATMIVPDAMRDERFVDNPFVTDAPGIRFYAGAPLRTTDGYNLGSLCVIDTEPRESAPLSASQIEILEALSRQAVRLLEFRRVSARLAATNVELERVSRSKDDFLASMSHELRTPLNTVLGMSEALAEGTYGELTEEQAGQLAFIHESGQHLLTLITDILDVAKIEADQMELALAPVCVPEVVDAAMRLVEPAATKKRLSVTRTDDSSVNIIVADGQRLKQVLVNLMSNAVKFTPEGGKVGVDIEGDVEAGVIRITVWDEGIGISQENQGRLFKSFVQLDPGLSRQHEGSGLGLVIARKMMELHNGTLTLESRKGEGSRFTMTMPWVEAPAGSG